MTAFQQQNGALHCEGVSLETIAREHGTPTYVYSRSAIETAFLAYRSALNQRAHLICYAVKANSNLAVLNVLAQLGAGFDVVSVGELERVIAAGGPSEKIVFSGIGKTRDEMQRALKAGIKCFNIESEAELLALAEVADSMGKVAPVSIRVNPDVDAGTHPYISTGLRENKFGVDVDSARRLYRIAKDANGLDPVGVDCHIGSQIMDIAPFAASLDCLLALIDDLGTEGIFLQHLDIGGGLGVHYDEVAPSIDSYVSAVSERLADRELELILEPGRSIVALAGALLTAVLYLKPTEARHFAVVDAAMNDLLRPALYSAWQDIQVVTPHDGEIQSWDIVGPICETGDFLGKGRELILAQGDLLAVMGAGAYGFAMASNYNSRPRAAEILVHGDSSHLIGQRESLSDLWQREVIPPEPQT
ncbi:MAG: diaminopimelate decarboxylase [Luminiphilus sp.]|jgi:diaminopimelate decarboxylase|nr:diaminopimelate decarboxylase [Luminiphilus sp.]